MSLTAAHRALINHLVTMPGDTNVFVPLGPPVGLPRYVVQIVGGTGRTATQEGLVDGTVEISVSVETEAVANGFATDNEDLVIALEQRFAVGTPIDGVEIIRAPDTRPPLPVTDGVYATPVIIRAETTF